MLKKFHITSALIILMHTISFAEKNNNKSLSKKPVSVYILSGQSNMVGAGKVDGGSSRWGEQFLDPEVSIYEGVYNSEANYDELKPSKVMKLEKFGGTEPTPYPTGGTRVTRGFVKVKETGTYEFRPGYGGSMENVMEVAGKVVHRKDVGGEIIRNPIKLEGGKKFHSKLLTSPTTRMDLDGLSDWMSQERSLLSLILRACILI